MPKTLEAVKRHCDADITMDETEFRGGERMRCEVKNLYVGETEYEIYAVVVAHCQKPTAYEQRVTR
ncbi:MAG: hypothetical protein ACR2P7_06680 [bacterium]